jgi:hypothetical protein
LADDRELAQLKMEQLQRQAAQMGTGVTVWFDGEILLNNTRT